MGLATDCRNDVIPDNQEREPQPVPQNGLLGGGTTSTGKSGAGTAARISSTVTLNGVSTWTVGDPDL